MRSNTSVDTAARLEAVSRVLILAGVGVMAGAASFTHMHDWTMANVPAGTGDWFGWANAAASELTPTVAVLDLRRRRRAGKTGTALVFPALVLVGSAGLSLAAQFARATPSVSGWLLAAVPAVAFLVLTKLVLSGGSTTAPEPLADSHTMTDEPCVQDTAPVTEPAPAVPAASVVRPVSGAVVVPSRINGAVVSPR
jgi:hypothetical protein